jgi:carbonic anhydrase
MALQFLREGNDRFVNNLKLSRDLLQQANDTREGQWPVAAILSCIDSRTSAELIFDQGLGDIFSIRVAGNVVNTDIIGSLEFACRLAGSRLIVVLGHSRFGAIKGACDHVELGNLTELLSKIQPAVYEEAQTTDVADRHSQNVAFVENVAALNVRRSVRAIINHSFILEELISAGEVAIIGAMHDLDTGFVTFFDDTHVRDHATLAAFADDASRRRTRVAVVPGAAGRHRPGSASLLLRPRRRPHPHRALRRQVHVRPPPLHADVRRLLRRPVLVPWLSARGAQSHEHRR